MEVGASTSCYYPLETEKALNRIGNLGFKTTEIFFNSPSELKTDFLKELKTIKDFFDIKTCSIHPFASFSETYMLFSEYERRFLDTVEFYKYFFEAAEYLGAETLVIHGCKKESALEDERYFERFSKLSEVAEEYNVNVAQENVVHYLSESPEFLKRMKEYMGDKFKMIFDVKQAVRAGYDPIKFIKGFEKNIMQVHISDHNDRKDCIPPGEGIFDFGKFIYLLSKEDFKGNYIIELYSSSFEKDSQLSSAKQYIESI